MSGTSEVLAGDFYDIPAEDVDETLSWEQPMERTWEEVEEDEDELLEWIEEMDNNGEAIWSQESAMTAQGQRRFKPG